MELKDAQVLVVKVGTSTLTYENGKVNLRRLERLCRTLSDLQNAGRKLVLVSSGAIGVGMGKLGLPQRPEAVSYTHLDVYKRQELYVVPPVEDGGEKVSSTRIRKAVEEGDIPTANRLLGRPFGFSLEVIHGNHIGTGLGTPTINQAIPEGFVLPRFGVYASWCRVGGQLSLIHISGNHLPGHPRPRRLHHHARPRRPGDGHRCAGGGR